MKLRAISFTNQGSFLCRKIADLCQNFGYECSGFAVEKYANLHGLSPIKTLDDFTKEAFIAKSAGDCDGIIFVGATGIAVRAIAPYLQSKAKDPAVLVLDEQGTFVISLVSGHIGGANDLAVFLADKLQATPVITTATDVNNCFAVDSWAVKNDLAIANPIAIKKVSGSLLHGQDVGLYSDFAIDCRLPDGVFFAPDSSVGICISYKVENYLSDALQLVPKILHIGVGCRRGTPKEQICQAVTTVLAQQQISLLGIKAIASIDLKKDELGLLEFCRDFAFDCKFYSAAELQQAVGDFTPSDFVSEITGVDNVCERAAVLSSGGKLIVNKQIINSVTVAIAEQPWRVDFGY